MDAKPGETAAPAESPAPPPGANASDEPAAPEETSPRNAALDEAARIDEPRILIADDSSTVRKVLANALATLHAVLEEAEDGVETLQRLQDARYEGLHFQLVFLNLNMPDLDGLQTLIQIRSNPRIARVPVVMMSTESERARVFECARHGIHGYLVKPFNIAKLLQTVQQALAAGASVSPREYGKPDFFPYEDLQAIRAVLLEEARKAIAGGLSSAPTPEEEPTYKVFAEYVETRSHPR
jgi:two-component system, chemotaxis family, chemotaxis protein CheY